MRFNFTAEKINFTVTDGDLEVGDERVLLRYECDRVDYSVDVLGLIEALPALSEKINELATQFDGK